jgi:hypothetical protein
MTRCPFENQCAEDDACAYTPRIRETFICKFRRPKSGIVLNIEARRRHLRECSKTKNGKE